MPYVTKTKEFDRIQFFARGSYLWASAGRQDFQPCEGGGTLGVTVTVEPDSEAAVKAAAQKWLRQRRAAIARG